eukprot:12996058-Alexandrium_andersonii.AAC.1
MRPLIAQMVLLGNFPAEDVIASGMPRQPNEPQGPHSALLKPIVNEGPEVHGSSRQSTKTPHNIEAITTKSDGPLDVMPHQEPKRFSPRGGPMHRRNGRSHLKAILSGSTINEISEGRLDILLLPIGQPKTRPQACASRLLGPVGGAIDVGVGLASLALDHAHLGHVVVDVAASAERLQGLQVNALPTSWSAPANLFQQ